MRAGLLHDGGAIVLDRALANAEVGRNVLAGVAGEHQLHDLALTRGQTREAANLRSSRTQAFATWADVTGVAMAA
jgi:hypothetical protein